MSVSLKIDLSGLAWDITGRAADYCAECKRYFENFHDPEDEQQNFDGEQVQHVPLQIFHDEGRGGMISLCWPCATKRIGQDKAAKKCRVCGCTEDNCLACAIKQGGVPCHWVEPDLCSACVVG